MAPRIPTAADFAPLAPRLPVALHFPSPPESTTAILVLLHGLGDSEAPFASFAQSVALPGVLAVSVRGTAPLPPSLLPGGGGGEPTHFHWGDDLRLDPATGELDEDPGFEGAARAVMRDLVRGVIVEKCGWEMGDVLVFGFGQGGSLALGLASRLLFPKPDNHDGQAADAADAGAASETQARGRGKAFKGVVSVGGPLPASMLSSAAAANGQDRQSATSVLVCQLGEAEADAVKKEFRDVSVVRWNRPEVDMPRDRDEMLPIMQFFAARLKSES